MTLLYVSELLVWHYGYHSGNEYCQMSWYDNMFVHSGWELGTCCHPIIGVKVVPALEYKILDTAKCTDIAICLYIMGENEMLVLPCQSIIDEKLAIVLSFKVLLPYWDNSFYLIIGVKVALALVFYVVLTMWLAWYYGSNE